jgi:hypothetical protein
MPLEVVEYISNPSSPKYKKNQEAYNLPSEISRREEYLN